jgi:hypothetical protein
MKLDRRFALRAVPGLLIAAAFGLDLPAAAQEVLRGAIRTVNGHFLTAVNGGGLGGPDAGPGSVALHSDAVNGGPWETFRVIWLDPYRRQFALRTINGRYVTAVNGGGIGGPNDGSSPFHTDASRIGPWELYTLTQRPDGTTWIRTPGGNLVTAVNGGGFGGPNDVPIHTDAMKIGPWERFTFVAR